MHSLEFEYCKHNDTQRDHERENRQEERAVDASLADCSRGKLPGEARPPIGEEANVHNDVTDYAGKQGTRGPSEQPQQKTCAKYNRDHA